MTSCLPSPRYRAEVVGCFMFLRRHRDGKGGAHFEHQISQERLELHKFTVRSTQVENLVFKTAS